PHLDRQLEEIVAAFVQRLGTEVADLDGAEDEVLEVLVAEVDAADLEEAGGAMRVLDAREHRERACLFSFPFLVRLAVGHQIARAPAQERRDVVRLERGDHQRADLALLRRLERLRVEHLDVVEVGPDTEAGPRYVLAAHHAGLGHAEVVGELRAEGALDLVALRLRHRLGRAHDVLDAELRQVHAFRLGEVGEVQRIARHAEPDGRAQTLDQLELQRRRGRGARARPVHRDAARGGATRVDLPDRMDAEREGDVRALAAPCTGAVEGARERLQAEFHVTEAARVEQRLAGDAARAPVLGDAVVRGVAELAVELLVRQRAQGVLIEDRDAAPDLGMVELRQVELRDALFPERRAHRPLDRGALAFALQLANLGAGPG